jgi:hypothetical protein
MTSFLATSNIQLITTLVITIVFNVCAMMFGKMVRSNTILRIWYGVSILLGFNALFINCCQLLYINSIDATSYNSGIIFIWYVICWLIFLQITSFLIGYILDIYYTINHTDNNYKLAVQTESQSYKIVFNKTHFLMTILMWIILTIIFMIIYALFLLIVTKWN